MTKKEIIAENERRLKARKSKDEVIELLPIPRNLSRVTARRSWYADADTGISQLDTACKSIEDNYSEISNP